MQGSWNLPPNSPYRTKYSGQQVGGWGQPVDQEAGGGAGQGAPYFDWAKVDPSLASVDDSGQQNPNWGAIGKYLTDNNLSFAEQNGPGEQWRWLEGADGKAVTDPTNYYTNDSDAFNLGAAGILGFGALSALGPGALGTTGGGAAGFGTELLTTDAALNGTALSGGFGTGGMTVGEALAGGTVVGGGTADAVVGAVANPLSNVPPGSSAAMNGGTAANGTPAADSGLGWKDVASVLGTAAQVTGVGLGITGAMQDPTAGAPPLGTKIDVDGINKSAAENDAAKYQEQLKDSRTNFEGPQGSQKWVKDGNGNWTLQQTLSPEAQALYNSGTKAVADTNNFRSELYGYAKDAYKAPQYDLMPELQGLGQGPALGTYQSKLASTLAGLAAPTAAGTRYDLAEGKMTATPNAVIQDRAGSMSPAVQGIIDRIMAMDPAQYNSTMADAVYGRAKRYMDPDYADQNRQLEARLAEQGFVPGTPAFAEALDNFRMSKERAYGDARDRGIELGYKVGNDVFDNQLSAYEQALKGNFDLGEFGLKSDQARSKEGLDLAKFTQDNYNTNFDQRRSIVDFLSKQDNTLFNQSMDSNQRALDISKALFSQNQAVDDAGRRAILDANDVSNTLFDRERAGVDVDNKNWDRLMETVKYDADRPLEWISKMLTGLPTPSGQQLPDFPSGQTQVPNTPTRDPFAGRELEVEQAINAYNAAIAQGANKQDAYLNLARVLVGLGS